MTTAHHPRSTIADVLALPEKPGAELIDGTIFYKAAPNWGHSESQLGTGSWLRTHFRRDPPGSGPGWWIGLEVDIELAGGAMVRPDISGWRKDRVPEVPRHARPCPIAPDWICEVLSPSNRRYDLIVKSKLYRRAGISHYWVIDPDDKTLTVHRLTPEGYLTVLTAEGDETVRPEPFGALEVSLATLLGID